VLCVAVGNAVCDEPADEADEESLHDCWPDLCDDDDADYDPKVPWTPMIDLDTQLYDVTHGPQFEIPAGGHDIGTLADSVLDTLPGCADGGYVESGSHWADTVIESPDVENAWETVDMAADTVGWTDVQGLAVAEEGHQHFEHDHDHQPSELAEYLAGVAVEGQQFEQEYEHHYEQDLARDLAGVAAEGHQQFEHEYEHQYENRDPAWDLAGVAAEGHQQFEHNLQHKYEHRGLAGDFAAVAEEGHQQFEQDHDHQYVHRDFAGDLAGVAVEGQQFEHEHERQYEPRDFDGDLAGVAGEGQQFEHEYEHQYEHRNLAEDLAGVVAEGHQLFEPMDFFGDLAGVAAEGHQQFENDHEQDAQGLHFGFEDTGVGQDEYGMTLDTGAGELQRGFFEQYEHGGMGNGVVHGELPDEMSVDGDKEDEHEGLGDVDNGAVPDAAEVDIWAGALHGEDDFEDMSGEDCEAAGCDLNGDAHMGEDAWGDWDDECGAQDTHAEDSRCCVRECVCACMCCVCCKCVCVVSVESVVSVMCVFHVCVWGCC
jgi:hypothetical protein